jgi:hypothetical protein
MVAEQDDAVNSVNAAWSPPSPPATNFAQKATPAQQKATPTHKAAPAQKAKKSSTSSSPAPSSSPGGESEYEKPPYSFPCLIGLALQSTENGRMSVAQIYDYVMHHFPYFRTAKAGWKNSVRHNLSLNKVRQTRFVCLGGGGGVF